MDVKRELSIIIRKAEDYSIIVEENVTEYLELAFKERKAYEYPVPDGHTSWEEWAETDGVDVTNYLPGHLDLWDNNGDYHEIYPMEVYKEEGHDGIYINGWDFTESRMVYGWYDDCHNGYSIMSFIDAVLNAEECDEINRQRGL